MFQDVIMNREANKQFTAAKEKHLLQKDKIVLKVNGHH